MNNHRKKRNNKLSRLERVERKCDRILAELAMLRKRSAVQSHSIDDAIERMHRNARRMRAETDREAQIIRKLLISKGEE